MAARFVVPGCVVVAAAGLFVCGCDGGSSAPPSPPDGTKSVPVAGTPPATGGGAYDPATATAVLRVRATVEGKIPAMRAIPFDSSDVCKAAHTTTVYKQSIECVDGKLANVIAWVSKGAEGKTYATPAEPMVLDQKGCMYVPHVFTAQVNQPIVIRNSDPTMHNIHAVQEGMGNEEFNHSQPKGAADMTERFAKPEVGVKIKCDVHGWMEAYAGVLPHPFHGVTDGTGSTEWKVPPGDYEISAWQESDKLAPPEPVKVTVGKGETKEIGFVFKVK
jgi:hypothetical protein